MSIAYGLGFAFTTILARRILHARDRPRVVAAMTVLTGAVILLPIQRGELEVQATLSARPTGLHPDVCLKGDSHPWRLIRSFDSQMLPTRLGGPDASVSRLTSHAEVAGILGPDSASRCPSFAREEAR